MVEYEPTGGVAFPEDEGTGLPSNADADWSSAGHFASLADDPNSAGFVVEGFEFSVDYTVPELHINSGKARIRSTATADVQDSDGAYTRTVDHGFVQVVECDGMSGIALTDDAVNHVWIANDPTENERVYFEVNADGTAPSDPSLKIGEVDTSNDESTSLNRRPDGRFQTLDVVEDGEGSGIDADTLRGNTPADLTADQTEEYATTVTFEGSRVREERSVNPGSSEVWTNGYNQNRDRTLSESVHLLCTREDGTGVYITEYTIYDADGNILETESFAVSDNVESVDVYFDQIENVGSVEIEATNSSDDLARSFYMEIGLWHPEILPHSHQIA